LIKKRENEARGTNKVFLELLLSLTKNSTTSKKLTHRRLRRAFSALPLSIFTPYANLPADGRVRGRTDRAGREEEETRDKSGVLFFLT
jgi:hypothetical protein